VGRTVRTSDGLDIAVAEFGGEGMPILLLHGLMGRAATWRPVAQWLTAHGRVIGFDARGHGHSDARGPWTTERMARDAAEVLGEIGPGVVIGHSMGGLHGLVLAARRPDLVRAVVVEDMGVDFRGHSADDARAWFGAIPQPFASLAEERTDGYHLLARIEDVVEVAAEWARVDHWTVLDQVRCPALLLEAERGVVPPGQMAEMARRMKDARHVVVPGTGHLVHISAPDAYQLEIRTTLVTAL
jgi:pimeloyl-ACP methyl ester carboxylesterase